ncbi:TetR/AcrR family transcriptional regulator [Streptosporangium sp. NPDC003464]
MAVCELISGHGLNAVTVARTAATAGMSVGLVQHYFRTKDDMLLHAFSYVSTQVRGRIDEHVRTGAEHRRPISQVLAEALAELIPLDERRRAEFRVIRTFAGRALEVAELAEVDTESARALRADLARAVHNGKECGEVAADLDPWPAAIRLAAVTEGLATQLYREPEGVNAMPAATLVATIAEAELAAIFSGECQQYR